MKNREPIFLVIIVIAAIAVGGIVGFKGNPFKSNKDIPSTTTIQQNTETQTAPTENTQSEETTGETYIYEIPEETTSENEVYYTFRYSSYLDEHYEKHKADTHTSSKDEYLYRANYVITNPNSLHKLEDDGDDIYYLESTNEIVFVSEDDYIRTYFCPDSGKAYYDRQ